MQRRKQLWIGLLLTFISVQGTPRCHAQTRKEPRLPFLIEWTIKKSPYKDEITRAIAGRKWKDAIRLCERHVEQTFSTVTILDGSVTIEAEYSDEYYNDEWNWQSALGELYIYDLQTKAAIQKFDYIRRFAPKQRVMGFNQAFTSQARRSAADGLAQAYAQAGMFPQALNWLRQSEREEQHGCGNCGESIRIAIYSISQVWKTANKPVNKAIGGLQQLIKGRYSPLKVNLSSQASSNKFQKQLVATEAALILGEIYARQGNRDKARSTFESLLKKTKSTDQIYIVSTYLDRI